MMRKVAYKIITNKLQCYVSNNNIQYIMQKGIKSNNLLTLSQLVVYATFKMYNVITRSIYRTRPCQYSRIRKVVGPSTTDHKKYILLMCR